MSCLPAFVEGLANFEDVALNTSGQPTFISRQKRQVSVGVSKNLDYATTLGAVG